MATVVRLGAADPMKPVVRLGIALLMPAILLPVLLFAAPAASAAQHAITMANYAFSPANETIQAGDSVTWTNTDQAPHDVTVTSGPVAVHSSTLTTGQSWTYTFTVPGTYSYICSIHPDMKATLVVRQAPRTTQPPTTAQRRTSTRASTPVAPIQTSTHTTSTQPAAAAPTTSTSAMAMPANQQQPPAQQTATASAGQQDSLNPMLLVAGIVAAVATLCLLLIGSRPDTRSGDAAKV